MRSLILGEGQIGSSVANVISRDDEVIVFDKKGGEPPIVKAVDILHICFPCWDAETFVLIVEEYIQMYQPMHVLIWATVPIGTTKLIRGAVHSPVEGRHPELSLSIKSMVRWLGVNDAEEGYFFEMYFKKLQMRTRTVQSSNFTEALKLLSTTEYGINLVFADYKAKVAKEIGMEYDLTKEWNRDYNKLYHNIHMSDRFQKFVLDAPGGYIGGHCVVPNAKLLYEQFPDMIVKLVEDMG